MVGNLSIGERIHFQDCSGRVAALCPCVPPQENRHVRHALGLQDDYWSTAGSYGFYNAANDGPYGFGRGWKADYAFSMDGGFKAAVGLSQEDAGGFDEVATPSGSADDPNVYVGVNYSGGDIYGAVIYYNAQDGGKDDAGGDAWRIRGDYDLSFVAPGAKIGGWYGSDSGKTDYVGGTHWGVTGKLGLGDDLTLFVGYGQAEDENNASAGANQAAINGLDPTDADDMTTLRAHLPKDYSDFSIGVTWTPLPGLLIQPEYSFRDYDNSTAVTADDGMGRTTALTGTQRDAVHRDENKFQVRVTRSF